MTDTDSAPKLFRIPLTRRLYILVVCLLLLPHPLHSFVFPSLYQCSALRITQRKGGRTYSKGYQVQSLYLRFTSCEVAVSGMHSGVTICRKLRIRRVEADTIFLDDPEEVTVRHSDLKLYIEKDTLKGNVNLFENDSSDLEIKALIRKIPRLPDPQLERSCR